MRADFLYGLSGRMPISCIAYRMRRWTGFKPSLASGSARATMTDMAYERYAVCISLSMLILRMRPISMLHLCVNGLLRNGLRRIFGAGRLYSMEGSEAWGVESEE